MKRFLLLLSFGLVFTAFANYIPNNSSSPAVYAQESKYIYVIGRAELEKEADHVEISFCIKNTAKSYNESQTKLNDSLQNLEKQMKEVDNNCEISITSCNSKPSFAKNNSYTSTCNFVVKTKCLDCIDKIMEIAGNNGVYCFNGVNYILENKQEVLNEAYELAKQDANEKAKNISEKAKLVDSLHFKQIQIPFSSASEKIKIEAAVKNMYELFNDDYSAIEKELDNANSENKEDTNNETLKKGTDDKDNTTTQKNNTWQDNLISEQDTNKNSDETNNQTTIVEDKKTKDVK